MLFTYYIIENLIQQVNTHIRDSTYVTLRQRLIEVIQEEIRDEQVKQSLLSEIKKI